MAAKRSAGRTGRPTKVPGETPTRQRIFDAAVDLFAERGYDRASIRDIAKAVGITESAFYRHYPSKESILEAILAYVEAWAYSPMPLGEEVGERAGSSVFRDLLEGLPKLILANPQLVKILHILFTEMHHNEKIRDYLKKEYGEKAEAHTEALFKELMDKGRLRPGDPLVLAKLFNSFRLSWLFQEFIINYGEPLDADKLKKDLEGPIQMFEQLASP